MGFEPIDFDSFDLLREHAYYQFQRPEFSSVLDFNYNKFILNNGDAFSSRTISGIPNTELFIANSLLFVAVGLFLYYLVTFLSEALGLGLFIRRKEMDLESQTSFNFERTATKFGKEPNTPPELSYSNSATPTVATPRFPILEFSVFEGFPSDDLRSSKKD